MNVYLLTPDSDVFDNLIVSDSKIWDSFGPMLGTSLQSMWHPVEAQLIRRKRKPDVLSFTTGLPACSAKGKSKLLSILHQEVEFLPLHVKTGEYYGVNATKTVDCLDLPRSQLVYLENGFLRRIERYVFNVSLLSGTLLFRLPQLCPYYVYATDRFRDLVDKCKITGLNWDDLLTG